jgi:hypothetical protein
MANANSLPNFDAEERKRKAAMAAPMSSAPMKYNDDGSVAWDEMWDSFCVLAQDGGPAHRATMLSPEENSDPHSAGYQFALDEIMRGVYLVSGLKARADKTGWVAVECASASMATWLANAGIQENVDVRAEGNLLLVPCGEHYALKGEVKNVITVVAKTTHYWADHIPDAVKTTMAFEDLIGNLGRRIKKLFGKAK